MGSDVSTTQSADEADYTEAQFDVAMENNQIPPGTYKVLFANGVVQEIQVEDDDVNLDQPRDTTNVVTTQGVMTQEEFDALPLDVAILQELCYLPQGLLEMLEMSGLKSTVTHTTKVERRKRIHSTLQM